MSRVRKLCLSLSLMVSAALLALCLTGCGVSSSIPDISINELPTEGTDASKFVTISSPEEAGVLATLINLPSDAYNVVYRYNSEEDILEVSCTLADDDELKYEDFDGAESTVWRTNNDADTTATTTTNYVIRVGSTEGISNISGEYLEGKVSSNNGAARTQIYYREWTKDHEGLCVWYCNGYSFSIYVCDEDNVADYLLLMTKIIIAGSDPVLRNQAQ